MHLDLASDAKIVVPTQRITEHSVVFVVEKQLPLMVLPAGVHRSNCHASQAGNWAVAAFFLVTKRNNPVKSKMSVSPPPCCRVVSRKKAVDSTSPRYGSYHENAQFRYDGMVPKPFVGTVIESVLWISCMDSIGENLPERGPSAHFMLLRAG